jgi:uncharacterized LabA/DUF88 family protein
MSDPANVQSTALRVRIFVDFWNFQLSVNGTVANFKVDWRKLGPVLATEAAKLVDPNRYAKYEGMHVYGSYDPSKPTDAKLKEWFTNTLDKMPGVNVVLRERQRKRSHPRCPQCQSETLTCFSCNSDMRGTEEKGIDTRIATDLVSLAWSNSYDIAVLLSADKDFVPVAEFLQTKGIKIIHGSFPPSGSQLSQKCWANINIRNQLHSFSR